MDYFTPRPYAPSWVSVTVLRRELAEEARAIEAARWPRVADVWSQRGLASSRGARFASKSGRGGGGRWGRGEGACSVSEEARAAVPGPRVHHIVLTKHSGSAGVLGVCAGVCCLRLYLLTYYKVDLLIRDACLCASRSGCDRLSVIPVFVPGVCVKVCVVLRCATPSTNCRTDRRPAARFGCEWTRWTRRIRGPRRTALS